MRLSVCGSWPIPAIAAVISACGAEVPADRGVTVRDSAGITIVESLEPVWEEGEGWTLSPEPVLDIGVVEGEAVYQFDGIRDVARWADGRIVVANGRPQEVRVYDLMGRFVRAVGREGEGPGEFGYLWNIQLRPADTIVAFDLLKRQMAAFDASSTFVWSSSLGTGPPWGSLASLDDGFFLWAWQATTTALMEVAAGEVRRNSAALVRHAPDGSPEDTIGVFLAYETASWGMPGGGRAAGPPLFARRLTYAVHSDLTYVGTGDGYEILVYGPDGSVLRIIRRPGLDLTATAASKDSLVAAVLERLDPGMIESYGQFLSSMPMPEERAPYGDFLVDAEGNLWVSEYAPDMLPTGSVLPGRWNVFEPEGRWLGEITVPGGFKVFEIGEDSVLGVGRDELDVEHIQLYRLVR